MKQSNNQSDARQFEAERGSAAVLNFDSYYHDQENSN